MQIRFTARHYEIDDEIKTVIEEKLQRLENTFGKMTEAHVTVEPIKHVTKLDISLHSRNLHITADDQNEVLRNAVDIVIEKLEAQLRKSKGRLKDHKHVSLGEFVEMQPEIQAPKVIEKTFVLKTSIELMSLSLDEAMDEIQSSGETFLVFHNTETSKLSILYPRIEGGFTLMEPKLPK
jgi:putative sigma-54 modulation protein